MDNEILRLTPFAQNDSSIVGGTQTVLCHPERRNAKHYEVEGSGALWENAKRLPLEGKLSKSLILTDEV